MDYEFFERGSPSRELGLSALLNASAFAILGHVAWLSNAVRGIAVFLPVAGSAGLFLVLVAAAFAALLTTDAVLQLLGGLEKSFLDAFQDALNRSFLNELSGLFSSLKESDNVERIVSIDFLFVVSAYVLIRTVQHLVDRRSWHTPWSTAHASRAAAPLGFAKERDFPCMIIGVGGSGKSTLAGILEQTYLKRRLFRIRTGGDIGEERETISRGAGESGIGGEILPYSVTWAPARYRVGRMADVYDLPGQLVDDWIEAFSQMAALENRRSPRRMAIVHVVSNGYNANIRKFKPYKVEDADKAGVDLQKDVNCGRIPYSEENGRPKVLAGYLKAYNQTYRMRDIEAIRNFASGIKHLAKKRAPSDKKPIDILLLHVVGMAHHWAEFHVDDEAKLRLDEDSTDNARAFYSNELSKAHAELRDAYWIRLKVDFLPASFQFGDVEVDIPTSDEKLKLFTAGKTEGKERIIGSGRCDKESRLSLEEARVHYEEESRLNVLRHSALAHATMKTVRAVRLALHRKPQSWFDEQLPTKRPEVDIFDLWRKKRL